MANRGQPRNKARALAVAAVWSALVACGEGPDEESEAGVAGAGGEAGAAGAAGAAGGAGAAGDAPNYDVVFPQDRVPRLDITITADNWKKMVEDMTSLVGEFGASGGVGGPGGGQAGAAGGPTGGPPGSGGSGGMGGPGAPPQELIDACTGLTAGEACKATLGGSELAGTCEDLGGTLACRPAGVGGPGGEAGQGQGGGATPGGGSVDLIGGTPVYVECDVALEGGAKLSHAGIRFKGNSSLSNSWRSGIWKLPLRLTFDRFEDDHPETKNQRLNGFKALSLSNGSMDDSLLRDKLGTDIFAEAGLPAPKTAFYRVYIDHGDGAQYFGLYTAIELPSDDSFLDRVFGNSDGNLYKPDGTGAQLATWDEATLGKENHEDEADFSDVRALFDALHADRTDAAAWRSKLEAVFDVEGFLGWLALNTTIQDWDTYGRMAHNYYLYADSNKGGRLRWIPWDHSFAFSTQQAASLGLTEITDQWPLIRYLMDDEVYQQTYRQKLSDAAKTYDPTAYEAKFTAAHALIKPYVVGAEGEVSGYTFLSSADAFESSLAGLIAHAKTRQQAVSDFIK